MLPKLKSPIHTIELPSDPTKKIRFRPFTVKEEKLLLMASESDDSEFQSTTIKQVINNCLLDKVEIDAMPIFDFEYLFIKLRARSVDNIMTVAFIGKDGERHECEVDLETVQVTVPEKYSNVVKLDDTTSITLFYPTFDLMASLEALNKTDNDDEKKDDELENVIVRLIDKVFDDEQVYDIRKASKAEIREFIESFTTANMIEVRSFFKDTPRISTKLEYKNNKTGEMEYKEVSGLHGFFTP